MKTLAHRKSCRIVFLFLIVIFSRSLIHAQELAESEIGDWVYKYGLHDELYTNFRYENYSVADTVKFREKLDLIKISEPRNEWEGTYVDGFSEVSVPIFRWNSRDGFIYYYINTCYPSLESIDYGNAIDTSEYVELLPEKTDDSPRKTVPSRYVKVKWGKDFYLVKESSLQAFAEKAVGIYVETEEDAENENFQKWSDFMVNRDESIPIEGLPQLPPGYRKFQRAPIEAKILTVGKKTIKKEDIEGTFDSGETIFYTIRIDAGKNKNVKVGMKFDIPETKEEFVITKVNQNSSVGLVSRNIDDNKKDSCYGNVNGEYKNFVCPQIKSSFKVKTQIGRFLF